MDLKVKIITEADLKGLQAFNREIKSAKDSAGAMMAAKGAQDARDTAGAYADMTKEAKSLTPALEETGKVAGKTALTKKALLDSIKQLTKATPELSSLTLALKNPYVMVAGVMAIATLAVKGFIDKVKEMAVAAQAFDNISRPLANFQTNAQNATRDAEAFADSLETIRENASSTSEELRKVNDEIDAVSGVERDELAAREENELAAIDGDDSRTAHDKTLSKRDVRNDFRQQRRDLDRRTREQKATASMDAALKENQRAQAAEEARPAAVAEKMKVEDIVTRNKINRDRDRKALDEEEGKLLEKLPELTDESIAGVHWAKSLMRTGTLYEKVAGGTAPKNKAEAERQVIETRERLAEIKRSRNKLDDQDKSDANAVTDAGKNVGRIEKVITEGRTNELKFAGDADSIRKRLSIEGRSQAPNIERNTAGINADAEVNKIAVEELKKQNKELIEANKQIWDAVRSGQAEMINAAKEEYRKIQARSSTPR